MSDSRAARLLLVDDVEGVRNALKECLKFIGYDVTAAASAADALELLRMQHFDLMLTDQTMPGLSGLELTEIVLAMRPDMPVVLLTGHPDVELAKTSLLRGASDFVTKPVDIKELPIVVERNLTRRRMEVARLREREAQVMFEAIKALASAVDAKDPYTARHSDRVTRLSLLIGDAIGLGPEERYVLELSAWMHDVGKIGIPDSILTKPARLTGAEFAIMKTHPVKGAEIVGQIEEFSHVADVIRHHHERVDGSGYPDGLIGEAIPLNARIIQIADAFEAMTSDRSYRKDPGRVYALKEIEQFSGSQFDFALAKAFVSVIADHPDL
ncbi:MAG TPA: HD domain-containing phosphohydrolase [Candidatus Baltobacteraceae bacterium]|nr:HD domain-containing phosphohydrolase [Candidatus Baltobacteraceae bacterium]